MKEWCSTLRFGSKYTPKNFTAGSGSGPFISSDDEGGSVKQIMKKGQKYLNDWVSKRKAVPDYQTFSNQLPRQ